MQTNPLIIIFGVCILIWLVFLTLFLIRIFVNYRNLIKGINKENLGKVLNSVSDLNKKINVLQADELKHIQKVGFVRFNPFNETGGDNSFTICLMNANLDGVVLTGLHTREKTRMYAKEIERGKSKYELSKEEMAAIKEAIK